MLVPDHCVRKEQHSTFDDSWTRSYLRGAWEKFAGNVTMSIINLSHMCAYSAILRLKIINNKSIEAIEHSKIPRDIWAWVPLSEIIHPLHRLQTGWCATVTNQSILPRILGISDIYIGEWSDRYGYIYFFSSGGGRRLPVKPYFFSFYISHSQHCLKMCVSWNQLSIFEHILYSNTSLASPKFIR